ncbi:MAG: RNA-binding protein [Ruminococcus sp.]|nr:RNA-binding protein [Ruminococcus sp.]
MNDSEDKLLEAKLGDMADRCERYGCPVYSSFLDEHECVVAEKWCVRLSSDFGWTFSGGFADARRKMLAVYPIYCSVPAEEDFPMKCLTFTYRKEDRLTHRDFLGSFMGQRLKREVIGDIIVSDGETQTFVTEVAAKAIMDSVTKIGRVGVKITDDVDFRLDAEQKYKEISGTVASLRLDCIVSLAANLSREKAAALIRSDRVEINHFTAASVSQELKEGDILSIRGSGRYILSGIDGLTKKGRIHINLRKYI